MAHCQICHSEPVSSAWQPFGPGETPQTFLMLGNHYRGFAVVKVGESCKAKIKAGEDLAFTYKRIPFVYAGMLNEVHEAPF